jgi:oxygen-dependent protoporphyrinogen oxidase
MPPDSRPRVAIIGGGIAGLAAAHRLLELAAARETPITATVYESSMRAGGALETIRANGCVIETGADSFLSEKPWALALAGRLEMSGEVIGTRALFRKTFVVRRGRLLAIPEGFSLLAPASIWPLLKSPLFSPLGKARILLEPFIPRRIHDGEHDESLAGFVTRRLGREALERVAQPLAGGIYTADPATLSVNATMPRFVAMENRYGSVIRGLRAAARTAAGARDGGGARWSLFVSFRNGVGGLIDALVARLGGSIQRGARVIALERRAHDAGSGPRWLLRFHNGSVADADAIICAAPAYAIAPLLAAHDASLSGMLAHISYASAATVNMAFRENDFPNRPSGFGFVVPIAERRRIIAGSFSSLKFAGRAPEGTLLARVFLGGALQTEMMMLDDAAMIAAARAEFASLLGVIAEPALAHVRRWPEAMPQYMVGHLARVAQIERAAAALNGIHLAGAYLRGVGIPDCVHSGETAAEAVFAALCKRA